MFHPIDLCVVSNARFLFGLWLGGSRRDDRRRRLPGRPFVFHVRFFFSLSRYRSPAAERYFEILLVCSGCGTADEPEDERREREAKHNVEVAQNVEDITQVRAPLLQERILRIIAHLGGVFPFDELKQYFTQQQRHAGKTGTLKKSEREAALDGFLDEIELALAGERRALDIRRKSHPRPPRNVR